MDKFRVRLKGGRVVGPFIASQILEMRGKSHVDGSEECQVFPAGRWLPITQFSFWNTTQANHNSDATFVLNLDDLSEDTNELPEVSSPSLPQHPLTDTKIELEERSLPANPFIEFDYKKSQHEPSHQQVNRTKPQIKIATPERPRRDLDSTIVSKDAMNWRKEQEEAQRMKAAKEELEESRRKEAEERERNKPQVPQINMAEDSTQIVSGNMLTKIRQEANRSELQLEKEVEKLAEITEPNREEAAEESANQADDKRRKRKNLFLIIAGLLLGYVILFPADEQPKKRAPISTVEPDIKFPVPFTAKNAATAKSLAEQAQKSYALGGYLQRRNAANKWRESYENDVDLKSSLYKMIMTYGWLIPHSSNFEVDGTTIFKLVQANKLMVSIDPDVALGTARFYQSLGKLEAAHDVLDRFVKSNSTQPSKELFATYLEILIQKDSEVKADEVAAPLKRLDRPGIDVYQALINFSRYKNHPQDAKALLAKASKEFPDSSLLTSLEGEVAIEAADMKSLADVIARLKKQRVESSKVYFGKLLEFQGFLLAFQNKPVEAAAKFSEALAKADSDSLRDKLVRIKDIDVGASDEASNLIKQIQARELVKSSESKLLTYDFEGALLDALNAQGLASNYIRADLHLAKLQLRMGMTQEALTTLDKLQKSNPGDAVVNFAVIDAYIETYKFNDARQIFTTLAATPIRNDWRYASLNAKMYERMGDLNQSIAWLQKAINLNPLDDGNIARLAQLFIRAKKFSQAKNRLFQAMELDPRNVDYKIAYGQIIYELEGADAAIAYLFGLLKEDTKNPALLGEIAIYYHRAGKDQQFKNMKKEIQALPVQDPRVHRFLIRSALLDEKWEEASKYTEELLKLEPGDLAAMMSMGKTLMSIRRYKDAAQWFVRVREKLPSYPKVGYFKALIELYMGNPQQAQSDVNEDMKVNGPYEEGVVLVGDIMLKQEKYPEADAQYKAALKLNNRSAGAMRGLASIALKKGQLDVALDLFKRALQDEKDNAEIYRQVGDIYRLQGQGALAIETYRVYLKLLPDAADKAQVEQYIRVLE